MKSPRRQSKTRQKSSQPTPQVKPARVTVGRLVQKLRDCGPEKARAAAESLGALGQEAARSPIAVLALVVALEHPDRTVARAASTALGKLRRYPETRERAIPSLETILMQPWSDPSTRLAARLMAQYGTALLARPFVTHYLRSIVRNSPTAAVSKPFLELLQAGMKGKDALVRLRCAEALWMVAHANIERPAVAVVVVDTLMNWDPDVRKIAVDLLRAHGQRMDQSPEMIKHLRSASEYGCPDAREIAARVLRNATPDPQP